MSKNLRQQFDAAIGHAKKLPYQRGDRVRAVKVCGDVLGTITSLPGEGRFVPPHLYVVKFDDGSVHGIDPSLLEPAS